MSERSGGRERSEQSGASERVSGASERANGRASSPVLQSVFLTVFDHSAAAGKKIDKVRLEKQSDGSSKTKTKRKKD